MTVAATVTATAGMLEPSTATAHAALVAAVTVQESLVWAPRTLADLECDHGRIYGDASRPCGCWHGERRRNRSR